MIIIYITPVQLGFVYGLAIIGAWWLGWNLGGLLHEHLTRCCK